MHIVKFKNGKYAIRRRVFLGYHYFNLKHGYFGPRTRWMYKDCQGTKYDVEKMYGELLDPGEEVDL